MKLELKAILDTAGPTATLVFASWLFLQYLNQRFNDASLQYRNLLSEYRGHNADHDNDGDGRHASRHKSVYSQILLYKKRCEQLNMAINVALIAAMFLLTTLLSAMTSMAFQQPVIISIISLVCSVIGIVLLASSAYIARSENVIYRESIDSEVEDIPEIVDEVEKGRKAAGKSPRREKSRSQKVQA